MKHRLFFTYIIINLTIQGITQNYIQAYRLIAERSDYYNYFTSQLSPGDSILYYYSGINNTIPAFKPLNLDGSSDGYDTLIETVLAYDSALVYNFNSDSETWELRRKRYSTVAGELLSAQEFHYCPDDSCFLQDEFIYYFGNNGKLSNYSVYSASSEDTTYKITYSYENGLLINSTSFYANDDMLVLSMTYDYSYDTNGRITSKTVHDNDAYFDNNELFSTEEFIYDNSGHLIQYNYSEMDYTGELFPRFTIYYTYAGGMLTEKLYEQYNVFYDEWSFTEKYKYEYFSELLDKEEYYLYLDDSIWTSVNATTYTYDNKQRLIKKQDLYSTTDYSYNNWNQLLQEINYDDSTFEASHDGYQIINEYDENGNRIYFEKGNLDYGYYQIQSKAHYYYESYQKPVAGFPTASICINVYPNPADELITVETVSQNIEAEINVQVHDMLGHRLYQSNKSNINSTSVTIDCSKYNSGFYVVSASDGINVSWQIIAIK